jgi:hypothetical protein
MAATAFDDYTNPKKQRAINYDYETEEVLGPLAPGWEKGRTTQGRVYFVE